MLHTPESRSDPVMTARTTTSPLSYSIIRDERLAKAIQPLAIQRGIKINWSAWTDSLPVGGQTTSRAQTGRS